MIRFVFFLIGIIFSAESFALPILNKTLSAPNIPLSELVYLDSEDPNLYWIHPQFNYCGLFDGKPNFKTLTDSTFSTKRVITSFDFCASRSNTEMDRILKSLRNVNKLGQLKVLNAVYAKTPRLEVPLAKEFLTSTYCIIPDIKNGLISCTSIGFTEKAERFIDLFKFNSGLIAAEYVEYSFSAVNQLENGQYENALPRKFQTVLYVMGLKEFPDLF